MFGTMASSSDRMQYCPKGYAKVPGWAKPAPQDSRVRSGQEKPRLLSGLRVVWLSESRQHLSPFLPPPHPVRGSHAGDGVAMTQVPVDSVAPHCSPPPSILASARWLWAVLSPLCGLRPPGSCRRRRQERLLAPKDTAGLPVPTLLCFKTPACN